MYPAGLVIPMLSPGSKYGGILNDEVSLSTVLANVLKMGSTVAAAINEERKCFLFI